MFQYEYEKRPSSASSCESRATASTNWTQSQKSASQSHKSSSQSYPSNSQSHKSAGQSYPRNSQSYKSENASHFFPSNSQSHTSITQSYPSNSHSHKSTNQSYPSDSRSHPNASQSYPSARRVDPSLERARRPLPPRPIVCERMPTKTTVPLKVWVIASASCFAVCAVLVLATVVITRWGAGPYNTEVLEHPEPIYANYYQKHLISNIEETTADPITSSEEVDNEIEMPVLEKLSIFKNIVGNRDRGRDLMNKPQLHPVHDIIHHKERKIEKKDKAKLPDSLKNVDLTKVTINEANKKIIEEFNEVNKYLPEFKPIQPNMATETEYEKQIINFKLPDIKLPEGYFNVLKNNDYDEYYNDENLYDDYMQSNSMTSYLIEKVQELHDWIMSDPDFEKVKNSSKAVGNKNEFGQLLTALNQSLHEGNVTIVMNKLRDLYFDNYTSLNSSRKVILRNGTDLLSFGILSLDIMLLHNIQLMAWENQEAARIKMLRDPDVFAFNALFMDPSKIEAKQKDIQRNAFSKRQNLRQEEELGSNLFENLLEVGVSAARAAIHLGRAYKNTKSILNQLSNREPANIQSQISRNVDGNTQALQHLQASYNDSSVASTRGTFYTELDCVWLLYCRNLAATAKLNAPFGTMARINGLALRMLSGELPAERALDTMLYEALAGWSELRCDDMFPKNFNISYSEFVDLATRHLFTRLAKRCSKVNAASVVLENIMLPLKKTQTTNRGR